MKDAHESLRYVERRRAQRGDQSARVWALAISLLVHIGLLYLAGGWLAEVRMRTMTAPFVVSLVAPDVAPAPREAPHPQDLEEEEAERRTEPPAALTTEDPGGGVPEAPVLEPTPEAPVPPVVAEPVRGESSAVEVSTLPQVRRDVVGETSNRLLEEMDAITRLPRSVAPQETEALDRQSPAARPGKAAGIEGPLGERGVLYIEYPPYADWAKREGIEAEVRFRFWVSSAGNVIRILALRKSGYPEFESLARQALAQWRFEPLPRGQERDEWGEVPIIWQLEYSPTAP